MDKLSGEFPAATPVRGESLLGRARLVVWHIFQVRWQRDVRLLKLLLGVCLCEVGHIGQEIKEVLAEGSYLLTKLTLYNVERKVKGKRVFE